MANQNESAQELLFDIKVAEASRLYKFYLNQEKKILGSAGVITFLVVWELVGRRKREHTSTSTRTRPSPASHSANPRLATGPSGLIEGSWTLLDRAERVPERASQLAADA